MPRKNRQRRPQAILPASEDYPSAQTFYRVSLLDEQGQEMFRRTSAQITDEMVLSRDGPAIEKIKAAHTPAELLDLISISTGLAQEAWLEQMRLLRLGAAPLIAERLTQSAAIEDASARTLAEERLVAALYLCGGLGADHLLRCFDSLSLYGQSLACMALGKAQAQQAADRIWAYYERVKSYTLERFLVGPLWALADLKDPRAGGALAQLLESGRDFYELPGLAALAGDRQAVLPLFWRFVEAPKDDKDDYAHALAAVSHRIGRSALREEFEKGVAEKSRATLPDKMVEAFWGISPEDIQDHFNVFYGQL
jgi:hypothetical protein